MPKPTYVLHLHHNILFEELTEPLENRIKYIKNNKPENEIATRLRLMRVLTDDEIVMISKKARKAHEEVRYKAWKMWKAYEKARKAQKARKAWKTWKVWEKTQGSPVMIKWHKKVCGCKEWQNDCLIF